VFSIHSLPIGLGDSQIESSPSCMSNDRLKVDTIGLKISETLHFGEKAICESPWCGRSALANNIQPEDVYFRIVIQGPR